MSVEHLVKAAKSAQDASKRIQGILIDLQNDLSDDGVKISQVNVDTRNFANMAVEIHID